jgi:hypothetical protein
MLGPIGTLQNVFFFLELAAQALIPGLGLSGGARD